MTSRSRGHEIFAGLLLMALTAGFGAWFISLAVQADNASLTFLVWLATAAAFNGIAFTLIGRLVKDDHRAPADMLPAAA